MRLSRRAKEVSLFVNGSRRRSGGKRDGIAASSGPGGYTVV